MAEHFPVKININFKEEVITFSFISNQICKLVRTYYAFVLYK